MNSDKNLKPCPFCGCNAELWQDYTGSWLVECGCCGVRTLIKKNKNLVIRDWNRRVKNGSD